MAEMWQRYLKDGFDSDATLELPLGYSHGGPGMTDLTLEQRDAHSLARPSSLVY